MSEKRTFNSIRNVIFSLSGLLITLLVSFVSRTVFIHMLSTEYLGLNGLFSNILNFLSLAELGVGSAINYALYKPLKNKDIEKIKQIMGLYKKLYIVIGWIVLVLGFSLAPFLNLLIKDMPNDMKHLHIYYLMYVINSGISYFCAYKRAIIICDQREYISSVISTVFKVFLALFQIIILILFKSYLLYLLVMIICTVCENIVISIKANTLYPYIKEKKVKKISSTEKKEIFSNIYALLFHKIGAAVVFSTDNIIISKYVGLVAVGLYSNYALIINSVGTILARTFSSLIASVGDLMVDNDKKHSEEVFDRLLFANMWIYGFTSICFVCLIQPFISLWIGDDYLLNTATLLVCICSYYITGMRKTVWVFKDAAGIYQQDQYKPVVEAILNIIFSIPLAIKLGITGVLLGTILSTIVMPFWYEGYVLYQECFHNKFKSYVLQQGKFAFVLLGVLAVTICCCSFFSGNGMLYFIIKLLICLIVPNLCLAIVYRNTKEFKYYIGMVSPLFKNSVREN
ncbi:MAG: hypothetical protein NC088_12985 [Bacteroides sp.]|nr:hypothetical protein [Bacteroides sp.]